MTKLRALTPEEKEQFDREGYVIMKGLFSEDDLDTIEQTFEEMSHRKIPGFFEPDLNPETTDPLKRYPRIIHPHKINAVAKQYMLHEPVMQVLEDLYQEEPLAVQSMYYYKPPGARGQALHQDNFYLMVEPGTCIAAWTAIDPADEENGCLLVVPKTNNDPVVCPEQADMNESFTRHLVKVPQGKKAIPAVMDRGDVLFFNGSLIHGSYRNKTKDRFRRSFICHYSSVTTTKIADFYQPMYRLDGSEVGVDANPDGGPCGVEVANVYPH